MKIKSISVKGLFHAYNHDITLSDDGLTFIHSQNGMGKSTSLKMINDLFSGNTDSLRSVIFDSMHLGTDMCSIDVVKDKDLRFFKDGAEVDHEDIAGMLSVHYLPPERLYLDDGEKIVFVPEILSKEFQGFFDESGMSLGEYACDVHGCDGLSDEEMIFRFKDLKARIDFISEVGIKLRIPSDLSFPPSRYEISSERERYGSFLSSLQLWTDRYYRIAESISAYLDIINGFFCNKKASLDDEHRLTVRMIGGETIPLKHLSAGERQIIVMTYCLLFRSEDGSLAIVDEPEISLHVAWQQKLGALFLEISRIRDLQIIVATHSPQIIHDLWDLAVELRPERA